MNFLNRKMGFFDHINGLAMVYYAIQLSPLALLFAFVLYMSSPIPKEDDEE